jgi:hypothetical protein
MLAPFLLFFAFALVCVLWVVDGSTTDVTVAGGDIGIRKLYDCPDFFPRSPCTVSFPVLLSFFFFFFHWNYVLF